MAMAMNSTLSASGLRIKPFTTVRPGVSRTRQSHRVIAQASKENKPNVAKEAVALIAAASLAFTGPASAFDIMKNLPGSSVGRDREEPAASQARSFMDSKEKTGPAVQSRQSDPNSGNVDGFKSSGTTQADARRPAGRFPMGGPNTPLSTEQQQLPATRGPGAGNKADQDMDKRGALGKANLRTTPTASNAFDVTSLQKSVAFGTGEVGTTAEQAKKDIFGGAKDAAKGAKDLVQDAGGATESSDGATAGKAKEAADKLSQANSEIPKALTGSKGVSFNGFDLNGVQHSAGMEMFNPDNLQRDVRVGDLSSIAGGQAKKAGPDSKTKASSAGGADAQPITNESTSGVKARGPSSSADPEGGGAAGRAERRPEQLATDKTAVP